MRVTLSSLWQSEILYKLLSSVTLNALSHQRPQDLQIILQTKMQTSGIKKRLHNTSLLHSVENRVRPVQYYTLNFMVSVRY